MRPGRIAVVAPLACTIRRVPSEAVLNEDDGMKAPCTVKLHNEVAESEQRVGKRVLGLVRRG